MFEERENNGLVTALEYLQSIYRDPCEPENRRMRAAIEALPFETPKLMAVGSSVMDGQSFGALLDRAIERIERSKRPQPTLIDVTPVEPHPASELKGPFARLRRRV
jgi:hypothetical protein